MNRFFQKLKVRDFITLTLWIILGFAWLQIDQIFLPETYQRFIALIILLVLFFYFQFKINRPTRIIQYANSIATFVLSVTIVIIVIQHLIITFDIQWKALLILFLTGIFPYIGAFVYKLTKRKMITDKELQELASQLKCPNGIKGVEVADLMNETNISMTLHSIDRLNLHDNNNILELGHGNCAHLPYVLQQKNNLTYNGLVDREFTTVTLEK